MNEIEEFVQRGMAGQQAVDAIVAENLCRLRLPASAIGSICGKPFGHDGRCGEPIRSTPRTPERS